VKQLVEACSYLESIYWRQSDPEGLTLYQSLAASHNPPDVELRRYMWINARALISSITISPSSELNRCRLAADSIPLI